MKYRSSIQTIHTTEGGKWPWAPRPSINQLVFHAVKVSALTLTHWCTSSSSLAGNFLPDWKYSAECPTPQARETLKKHLSSVSSWPYMQIIPGQRNIEEDQETLAWLSPHRSMHIAHYTFPHTSIHSVVCLLTHIPVAVKTGLVALARDPRERKMPMMTPFWSDPPYTDTSVVRQGTTVAEAEIYIRYLNNITGHKYLVQNKQEIKEKAF